MSRLQQHLQQEDAAEEVHRIHGTTASFSSNNTNFDEKAIKKLRQIQMGLYGLSDPWVRHDPLHRDPQDMPGEFFLGRDTRWLRSTKGDPLSGNKTTPNGQWRPILGGLQGIHVGGAAGTRRRYVGIKKTYVYHKGDHKTKSNWIMVVYRVVHEGSFVRADDIHLCHVFQSDNYDPSPERVPDYFAFDRKEVNSRAEELESLIMNPRAFKDFDEFHQSSTLSSTVIRNGSKRKQSEVWERFTKIKVLGPEGEMLATLAICNRCSMAYLTGKLCEEDGNYEFKNNGTKTLGKHKCSGQQHHIAGNT